jgi:hypothetical protein
MRSKGCPKPFSRKYTSGELFRNKNQWSSPIERQWFARLYFLAEAHDLHCRKTSWQSTKWIWPWLGSIIWARNCELNRPGKVGYPLVVSWKALVSGLSEEANLYVDLKQIIHPIGQFGSFHHRRHVGVAAKRLNTSPWAAKVTSCSSPWSRTQKWRRRGWDRVGHDI